MIQLILVIVVPLLIVFLHYVFERKTNSILITILDAVFKSLPNQFGYMFFLYYLGMENIIDTGWTPITLIIFLIPITIIVLFLKLILWVRNKKFLTRNNTF